MRDELEWAKIKQPQPSSLEVASSGALRVAMLFGGLALAMALVATPIIDRKAEQQIAKNDHLGVDPITTASARKNKNSAYIVRKSVVQNVPGARCVIHANGTSIGDC